MGLAKTALFKANYPNMVAEPAFNAGALIEKAGAIPGVEVLSQSENPAELPVTTLSQKI